MRLWFGLTVLDWTSSVPNMGFVGEDTSAGTCGSYALSPAKRWPYFQPILDKGEQFFNFLFAFPDDEALPK